MFKRGWVPGTGSGAWHRFLVPGTDVQGRIGTWHRFWCLAPMFKGGWVPGTDVPVAAGILRRDGGAGTHRRLGRRGLGRPRPDAGRRRPAGARRADRARLPRRVAFVPAVALVGGLADVPDGPRSCRPRRVRHPRTPAWSIPADAGVVALAAGPHLAHAAVRGGPARAGGERAADLSPA